MPVQVKCGRCGAHRELLASGAGTPAVCECGSVLQGPPAAAAPGVGAPAGAVPLGGTPAPELLDPLPGMQPPLRRLHDPPPNVPGQPARSAERRPRRRPRPSTAHRRRVVRAASRLGALTAVVAATALLSLSIYQYLLARRIDGDWRSPGGMVLVLRSGTLPLAVPGAEHLAAGDVSYRRGVKRDRQLLVSRSLQAFAARERAAFRLLRDGTVTVEFHYTAPDGRTRHVVLTTRARDDGRLEVQERTQPPQFLKAPLVLARTG